MGSGGEGRGESLTGSWPFGLTFFFSITLFSGRLRAVLSNPRWERRPLNFRRSLESAGWRVMEQAKGSEEPPDWMRGLRGKWRRGL